jgi:hypothetical protein
MLLAFILGVLVYSLGRYTRHHNFGLSWFSQVPPGNCQNSSSKLAITVSPICSELYHSFITVPFDVICSQLLTGTSDEPYINQTQKPEFLYKQSYS